MQKKWRVYSLLLCGAFLGSLATSWAPSAQAQEAEGFKPIFNGRNLDGWDGNEKFWSVEDGAITGRTTPDNPTPSNTFLVWRAGKLDDFELRLKFRIVGGNSGIQFRSREVDKWVIAGYQADFDAAGEWTGTLYEEKGRETLAKPGLKVVIDAAGDKKTVGKTTDAKEILDSVKKEAWNDYTIIARGNHIVQMVNGKVAVDLTDNQVEKRAMSGLLALQLHQGPPMTVQFKDIQLKTFPKAADGADNNASKKKIVFLAGRPSHGYGSHEHNAGCLLLAKSLSRNMPQLEVEVYPGGWPKESDALDRADAIVMYCDGGGGHMVNEHLDQVDRLMRGGVGLVCLHYGVEVEKGDVGEKFKQWIGGHYEHKFSVNPIWSPDFHDFPDHPITRGVKPFQVEDEWYFNMRFRNEMEGVTPILVAKPSEAVRKGPYVYPSGPYPHIVEAVGRREVMMWATEREDGGRGVGFTGGHFHWNWGNDNFRKVVLNAIVWAAKGEVPDGGVIDQTPTRADLEENLDEPKPRDRASVEKREDHAPGDAVGTLDVAPQLEATLFASEPMMVSPSNIDVDHRGRVWVCEIVNYRHFANKNNRPRDEGDRILILEDTDGDGRADVQKVFYQGRDIDSPHGVCVLGTPDGKNTRAIVSAAGHVWLLTDTDGDDRADKKEVLFSGIRGAQHDHTVHTFMFGPDGKLYFNFGNEGTRLNDANGQQVVDTAGNTVVNAGKPYRDGMVFRCNLDGSELETLAWNFRNNWMMTVDSFGTIWQSDNDDDGNRATRINFVMEFGNYGFKDEMTGAGWRETRTGMHEEIPLRHWHLRDPGVVPNMLQTGAGSPAGITIYEGDLLPPVYRNGLIHTDPGPNICRAYLVTKDRAGYQATIKNVLEGARDKWFRPIDVQIAPDGSLIVADWYDPGVGGHAMGDLNRGRLFRVTPIGHQGYKMPTFDFSTAEGAARALKNPNFAVRFVAWQALHAMGEQAEPALNELWTSDNPRYRARALWLLGRIEGRGQSYVDAAIADANSDIRITGLRLARQLKLDVIPLVKTLVHDSSPQVRRECAIALRHNDSPAAAGLWTELAVQHDGHDRWYLEALGIGADRQWDAFFSAWLAKVGESWNTLAGRDVVWRSRAAKSPEVLTQIIIDRSVADSEVLRCFRAFDFLKGSEKDAALLHLATLGSGGDDRARLIAVETFARLEGFDMDSREDLAASLGRVLDGLSGSDKFVELVDKFNVADRYPDLLAMAQKEPGGQLGVRAMRVLLAKRQNELIGRGLSDADVTLAAALATALGNSADGRAMEFLLPIVEDASADLELRRQATGSLAKSGGGAVRLLEMIKSQRLDKRLMVSAAATLSSARWPRIRAQAAELFPLPPAKNNEPLPPLAELVRMEGDARRGKEIYNTTGTCATCHQVNGEGKEVGPDLSEIGSKLSRAAFFESILYPSAGINHNYETYLLALEGGNIITGVLVSQTDKAVTIKSDDAIARTFPRAEIEAMKQQDISLMPADLQKNLAAQDLADVVEYMTTLKKADN